MALWFVHLSFDPFISDNGGGFIIHVFGRHFNFMLKQGVVTTFRTCEHNNRQEFVQIAFRHHFFFFLMRKNG